MSLIKLMSLLMLFLSVSCSHMQEHHKHHDRLNQHMMMNQMIVTGLSLSNIDPAINVRCKAGVEKQSIAWNIIKCSVKSKTKRALNRIPSIKELLKEGFDKGMSFLEIAPEKISLIVE